jgi:hypothetical protein
MRTHRPPTTCPVCSESLITLRLGCPSCGTEVSGHFDTCRFCRLDAPDRDLLEVFLRSRGNIRDVQAHLAVSYPTARARLVEVLDRLGLGGGLAPEEPAGAGAEVVPGSGAGAEVVSGAGGGAGSGAGTQETLTDLAAGVISVAEAERRLAGLSVHPQQ